MSKIKWVQYLGIISIICFLTIISIRIFSTITLDDNSKSESSIHLASEYEFNNRTKLMDISFSPEEGDRYTEFTIKAEYIDLDNFEPIWFQLYLSGSGHEGGHVYNMEKASGEGNEYEEGVEYQQTIEIDEIGDYKIHFSLIVNVSYLKTEHFEGPSVILSDTEISANFADGMNSLFLSLSLMLVILCISNEKKYSIIAGVFVPLFYFILIIVGFFTVNPTFLYFIQGFIFGGIIASSILIIALLLRAFSLSRRKWTLQWTALNMALISFNMLSGYISDDDSFLFGLPIITLILEQLVLTISFVCIIVFSLLSVAFIFGKRKIDIKPESHRNAKISYYMIIISLIIFPIIIYYLYSV